MGRLWLPICAVLLCNFIVLSTASPMYKKNLKYEAELSAERAAEKAAERALAKSLNPKNSSDITITVVEGHKNAKKTEKELVVSSAKSTRSCEQKIRNRQYDYQSPDDGQYKVSDSSEADELGIAKDSLNSSIEDIGSVEAIEKSAEGSAEVQSQEVTTPDDFTSFESAREPSDKTSESSEKDLDLSFGQLFDHNFSSLLMSGDSDEKSSSTRKAENYTPSFTKPKEFGSQTVTHGAIDTEVLRMYDDKKKSGWSDKSKVPVKNRSLWDNNKSRVSRRSSWDDFSAEFSSEKPKPKIFKRMAGNYDSVENTNQVAVPMASLSLDPKAPALLYKLLQKQLKYSPDDYSHKSAVPMKLYVTVPVPYLRANKPQDDGQETTLITPRPYHAIVSQRQTNEEMDDQGAAATKRPKKRSSNFRRPTYRNINVGNIRPFPRGRFHRSLNKVTNYQLNPTVSTVKPMFENASMK